MKEKEENFEQCKCGDECECTQEHDCSCKSGKECTCDHDHSCHEHHCNCGEECDCDDECDCDCGCGDKAEEYLTLARQVQADFENFRRHAIEDIKNAKVLGQQSVIEVFLPCLDTFKEAKKSITDENVLQGVNMIENKIIQTLDELGVKKIDSIGQKYNPHLHNVIAVMKNEEEEEDIILDEYQAGYTFNEKVIRYSKVIVNKKED